MTERYIKKTVFKGSGNPSTRFSVFDDFDHTLPSHLLGFESEEAKAKWQARDDVGKKIAEGAIRYYLNHWDLTKT